MTKYFDNFMASLKENWDIIIINETVINKYNIHNFLCWLKNYINVNYYMYVRLVQYV